MLDKFFDKIYCINLDERTDRWELAQKEFERLGVKNYVRFPGKKTHPGYIGCRDSHIGVFKDAKENNYNRILILEDDFIFINNDEDLFKKVFEQLEKIDYDMFFFGATIDPKTGRLEKVDENLVRTNFAFAAHAYSVNSKHFDFIINEAPKYPIIDVFYQNFLIPKGGSYISNPMMCLQRPNYSDIEKTNVDYNWMIEFYNNALNKIKV